MGLSCYLNGNNQINVTSDPNTEDEITPGGSLLAQGLLFKYSSYLCKAACICSWLANRVMYITAKK